MPEELSVKDTVPEKFGELFPFEKFNYVQSLVLPSVLNTDENIVVCSPTASGKTVIAELAIIRQLKASGKTLYLGPLKALTYEKEEIWGKIFSKLGYKVYVTTGDEEISPYEANGSEIIVSTPEKWDSASRKWSKKGYNFVNNVSLLIIDEVHLLDSDNRGGVLEAIVSRMRRLSEVNGRSLRIIALSATMSNYRQVAEWIGAKESFTFYFDSSARPVPLSIGVYPYNETNNKFYNMYLRLYKALDLSKWVLAEGNQVLIFVASRRDTRLAANKIAKVWEEQATSYCTPQELAELKKISNEIRNTRLKEVFSRGVAFHHAGLSPEDRFMVESCFRNGLIKILVSTSTLAWGVNLPAKVVIIRDTQIYDTLRGEREINPLDLLQMLGRAGRPQYDKEGIGWVIVRNEATQKYRNLLLKERGLESRLLETLPEHLNAEIVLGTIENEKDALNWIKTSFLYIREKNRRGETALNFLEDEIRNNVRWLEEHGFILRENNKFEDTKLAEIACNYYLDLETAELFYNEVKEVSDDNDILSLVSRAKEFEDIVVRRVEKKFLKTMLSNIETHFTEELNEPQKKVLAILLSYLKQIKIMEDLRADSWIIKQNALRLLAALERFATELRIEDISRSVRLLNFKLEKGALDEQVELIQVSGIGPKTAELILSRGIKNLDQLLQTSAYDLTRIGLPPKTSKKILEEAKNLPKATISVKINQIPKSENIIELQTTVQNSGKTGRFLISIWLNNKEILKKAATITKDIPWTLPLKLNISNSPIECKIKIDYLDLFRAPETLQTTIKPSSKTTTELRIEPSLLKTISESDLTTEKAMGNQLPEIRSITVDQPEKILTQKRSVYPDLNSFTAQTEPTPVIQKPEIRKKEKTVEPSKKIVGKCKICGGGLSQEGNKIICNECESTYKLPRNASLTDQKCSKCGLPKFRADYVFPIQACVDRSCENADEIIQRKFYEMKLKCPNCGGSLVFLRRRGLIAGCENYYKGCKTAFKLPTIGVLLDQKCPKCSLPLVKLKTKTRCLNTKCESK